MPHLVLSITNQLTPYSEKLLQVTHQAMLDSQIAISSDIKSRIIILEQYLIGDNSDEAFAHAEVRILRKPERTQEVQKALSDVILEALIQTLQPQKIAVQVSCDIIEMNTPVYGKSKIEAEANINRCTS